MSSLNKFIQGFFWFAFAAFLTASIAHVAFFFRAFEPQNDGRDLLWWGVSYGIAASIDVTIFLLSITVASLHRARRTGGLIFSVWVFIAGLTALSFYINYKYAQHFSSLSMISPTALALPYVGSIGDINPYIASMFQALAVAYTWIADKIVSDEKPISAEELKAQADEMEARARELARIESLKHSRSQEKTAGATSTIKGLIRAGKEIAKEALAREQVPGSQPANQEQNGEQEPRNEQVKSPQSSQQEPAILPDFSADTPQRLPGKLPTSEEQNEGKAEVNTDALSPTFAPASSPAGEQETGEIVAITGYDVIASWVSTGRKSATIEDVSRTINLSAKVLKRRVSKGVLKTTPRNPDLILLASVLDWLKGEQNEQKVGGLNQAKSDQNGRNEEMIFRQNGHNEEPVNGALTTMNASEEVE